MFISVRLKYRVIVCAVLCLFLFGSVFLFSFLEIEPSVPASTVSATVYLTFDDGPSKNTAPLLEVLRKEDVKATFFVTAQNPEYLDQIAAAHNDGHLIALHTYNHDFDEIYSTPEAFWDDIEKLDAVVLEQTGTHSNFLRFPGGSSNTVSHRCGGKGFMKTLVSQCEERGFVYFDWNIDTKDAEGGKKSPQDIALRAVRGIDELSGTDTDLIILMHDGSSNPHAADAAQILISQLRSEGYLFDTLDHLAEPVHHTLN